MTTEDNKVKDAKAAEAVVDGATAKADKPELENETVDALETLKEFPALIERSAQNFDPRYILKVFRELTPVRKEITSDTLVSLIESVYPPTNSHRAYLLEALSADPSAEMDTEDDDNQVPKRNPIPEVDIFIHLLVQIYLHDKKQFKKLHSFNKLCITALRSYDRRTLDYIQAKVWYYIFRSSELTHDLITIRADLMRALRTATLRHDSETRASTISLLLRDYLLTNDINQAYNLVEKTEFPENASNSVVARYYYYLARIQAIQLDYSSASECVIAAARKCSQTKSARGFLQTVTKLHILIQLLTGEIPDLTTFRDPLLETSLLPYLAVTRAVRLGDLKLFNETLQKYGAHLKRDDNYNLVLRLRQNVIKTGIRIISLSYKRISLKDICIKLHLDSEISAEYIVAKAIKDGVIDASINHKAGYMQSRELLDVYSTRGPQAEFDRRIKFCMSLHDDSVKAMRYPMNMNRVEDKVDPEAREREQELIQYLQDADGF
ncbi:DEKNAAC100528 [Brettanomyces naardenensis]|uniref:DEKNAAC100528 n=1 Tax=Brettanomyces naardenensis TaxID=13370 RepID=A0A448YES3_BRENA|nr:DEKNAAC100528 [Brettanomyces naardenensis]